MTNTYSDMSGFSDPELLANNYLKKFYNATPITFPVSPFEMLNYESITFVLRNFNKLEGVYIPAEGAHDVPVVAINARRPITRQRFTAAHELCHHLKDSDSQIACAIGARDASENSQMLLPRHF